MLLNILFDKYKSKYFVKSKLWNINLYQFCFNDLLACLFYCLICLLPLKDAFNKGEAELTNSVSMIPTGSS
jgi:hypothetical protein